MVVPGITLIRRERMLGACAPHHDQATRLVGVGAVKEQCDRVIAIDLVRFHMTLKFTLHTPQVSRRAFAVVPEV